MCHLSSEKEMIENTNVFFRLPEIDSARHHCLLVNILLQGETILTCCNMHQSSITYRNFISSALYNSYVIYDQFRSQEKHNTLGYDYLFIIRWL